MHKDHSVFKPPEDENVKIWRYMDSKEFEFIIDRKALFFAKVDILDDKFEGSFSKVPFDPNLERKTVAEGKITENQIQQNLQNIRKYQEIYNKESRKGIAINCWHINNCESAEMWKQHTPVKKGIAIQSTYRRLADSFHEDKENEEFIGCVNYIDYEKEAQQLGCVYDQFIYKNKCHEYEKELRVLISKFPPKGICNRQ